MPKRSTVRRKAGPRRKKNKLHFFDLPFEIRHQIYDDAIEPARIVYSISGSTLRVRHCLQPLSPGPDLPFSDQDFDAPLLVSKQFHREVKPILLSKSQVVLVADADREEISPTFDVTKIAPYVKHLEINIRLLEQISLRSLFPNLKQITITHDITFDTVLNLWEPWTGATERKIRAAIAGNLERNTTDEDFTSRLPEVCQATTRAPEIIVKGHYRAKQRTDDPREWITFLSVYENDYTYDLRSRKLEVLPPALVSKKVNPIG